MNDGLIGGELFATQCSMNTTPSITIIILIKSIITIIIMIKSIITIIILIKSIITVIISITITICMIKALTEKLNDMLIGGEILAAWV